METISLKGAAVLVLATFSVGAWAADEARVRPAPDHVLSVDSPGTPGPVAAAETWVATPGGVLRAGADASDVAADPARPGVPGAVNFNGPNGQLVRVVPGALSSATVAVADQALPFGTVVVEVGDARVLRVPGVADGLEAPAVTAPLPAGMRIVDLPPGAVAPVGMPEPMTLYRVTSAPGASTALPDAPE